MGCLDAREGRAREACAGRQRLRRRGLGPSRTQRPSAAAAADLFTILKATEKLERAWTRDAISAKDYEPACERLIAQFKTLWETIRDSVRCWAVAAAFPSWAAGWGRVLPQPALNGKLGAVLVRLQGSAGLPQGVAKARGPQFPGKQEPHRCRPPLGRCRTWSSSC